MNRQAQKWLVTWKLRGGVSKELFKTVPAAVLKECAPKVFVRFSDTEFAISYTLTYDKEQRFRRWAWKRTGRGLDKMAPADGRCFTLWGAKRAVFRDRQMWEEAKEELA